MKTRTYLITPVCLVAFAFASPLRADGSRDGHDDHNVKTEHHDGKKHSKLKPSSIVKFEARTKLSPPGAPVVGGPLGAAEVEVHVADGVAEAEVELATRGLPAGTYTVAVTKKSDGSVVTLGSFTVATFVPPVVAGKSHHGKRAKKTKVEFETEDGTLPADFDGFDVAAISVSDGAATVVLAGDLTRSSDLVKRARMVADASVPAASGRVSISVCTRGGVAKPRFVLEAKGLPAGAALQLAIDGADVQAVTPGATGCVTVRALPATVDIAAINTVAIHDAVGVNLLSATFQPSAE